MEVLMGRGSELVSWLTWEFVIPCRLIMEIGGAECTMVSSIVMAWCGEGDFG